MRVLKLMDIMHHLDYVRLLVTQIYDYGIIFNCELDQDQVRIVTLLNLTLPNHGTFLDALHHDFFGIELLISHSFEDRGSIER